MTPSGRKRQSSDVDNSSPTLHRQRVSASGSGSGGGTLFQASSTEKASPHQHMFASPTKRRRPSTSQQSTMMKTPTKMASGGSTGSVKSSSSGMATPPPTSTTSARKRGRPKKKDVIDGPRGMSPPPTSPTVSSRLRAQDPIPQPQFTMPTDIAPTAISLQPAPVSIPTTSAASNKTPLWENPVELALELGVSPPDWAKSQSNIGDLFNSMDTKGTDKLTEALGMQDPMAFSFMASNDPLDTLPGGVDPNLIFGTYGSTNMSGFSDSSFGPDSGFMFSDQPYQHQMIQQQLEAMEAREKEKEMMREQAIAKSAAKEKRHKKPSILAPTSVLGRANALEDPFKPSRSGKSKAKARGYGNDENVTPPPVLGGPFSSDDTNSSTGIFGKQKLPTVLFSISPSGRAKTEIVESETEVEDNVAGEIHRWGDYLDSDSSFDDDAPRGLGPGGREYPARTCYGSPSLMGSSRKPKLARHNTMPAGMRNGWDGKQQSTPQLKSAEALQSLFNEPEPKLPTIRNTPSTSKSKGGRRGRPPSSSTVATPHRLTSDIDIALLNNNSPPKENAEDDAQYRLRKIRAERQSSIQHSSSTAPTPSHHSSNSDPTFPPSLYPTAGHPLLGLAESPNIRPSLSPPISGPLFSPTPQKRRPKTKIIGEPSSPARHLPTSPTPMPKRMAGKVPRHQPIATRADETRTRCICNPTKAGGTTMVQW